MNCQDRRTRSARIRNSMCKVWHRQKIFFLPDRWEKYVVGIGKLFCRTKLPKLSLLGLYKYLAISMFLILVKIFIGKSLKNSIWIYSEIFQYSQNFSANCWRPMPFYLFLLLYIFSFAFDTNLSKFAIYSHKIVTGLLFKLFSTLCVSFDLCFPIFKDFYDPVVHFSLHLLTFAK